MRLQHTESDGCHMRGITSDRNYARWQNFLIMHERSGRVKITLITGSLVRMLPHSKMQTLKLCRREEPGNFPHMSSVKGRERVERFNWAWAYPKALNRKRVKVVGNLLHVSSYQCPISYTLSIERIVV